MDALSETLKVLHLTSGIFLEADFSAPWCIDSAPGKEDIAPFLPDAEHVAIFHLLVDGTCRTRLPGSTETLDLAAGDLLMFPHGDPHILGSDLHLNPIRAALLVRPDEGGSGLMRIRHGGDGPRTQFICGYMACDKRLCRPLLSGLPRMLRVSLGEDPATRWMMVALQHGAEETHAPQPGREAVMGRLAELLFVEALRCYIRQLPEKQQGWLAGLRDPYVGKALALMHARPADDWQVDSLASEVGLSRSALAERFSALIGEPPMQYLARWRLALAAQYLARTNEAVARVGERVGYESEAAFNRAFKREFGAPPAAWRRSARLARAAVSDASA
jgi:AraC-like DNA-binding protein